MVERQNGIPARFAARAVRLAIRMKQPGQPCRGDDHWHRHLLAEDRRLGLLSRDVDHHPLAQPYSVEVAPVRGDRQLVVRSAVRVVENHPRDALASLSP
jgi:hypothetical protein